MSFDTFIEETMDEAMRPYTDSEAYKTERTQINKKIAAFLDKLTSTEQKTEFLQLVDMINNGDAECSVHAYTLGVKTGISFQKQLAEQ